MGASTGLNIAAAKQVAELMGPGHTIVTCLCDTGQVGIPQILYTCKAISQIQIYEIFKKFLGVQFKNCLNETNIWVSRDLKKSVWKCMKKTTIKIFLSRTAMPQFVILSLLKYLVR